MFRWPWLHPGLIRDIVHSAAAGCARALSSMESYFEPGGDTARKMFAHAATAGVFRNEWQNTVDVSPESWGLRSKPFWTPDELGDRVVQLVADIKANFDEIRAEGLAAVVEGKLPRGVKPFGQNYLLKEGTWWDQVTLWGKKHRGFDTDICGGVGKQTCAVLDKYQDLFHPQGEAKFSHMVGPTKVVAHCGPVDTKIRLHMMLQLPPHKRADIIVANETRAWQLREVLLFHDSMEHTVMLDIPADAHRTVLIIDLWHPDVEPQHRIDSRGGPPRGPGGGPGDGPGDGMMPPGHPDGPDGGSASHTGGETQPPQDYVQDDGGSLVQRGSSAGDLDGDADYTDDTASEKITVSDEALRVIHMEQQARLVFAAETHAGVQSPGDETRLLWAPVDVDACSDVPADQSTALCRIEAVLKTQPAPEGFPSIDVLDIYATSAQLFERVRHCRRHLCAFLECRSGAPLSISSEVPRAKKR